VSVTIKVAPVAGPGSPSGCQFAPPRSFWYPPVRNLELEFVGEVVCEEMLAEIVLGPGLNDVSEKHGHVGDGRPILR
jgi:hypothetical protein